MQPIMRALHGLHHVRFLGLEDIAVHAVMMQRQPPARVAMMKRRFLEAFGYPVGDLYAMPELDALAQIPAAAIAKAIRHEPKAARIAEVVRAVAALGENFLRTAPYEQAKQALLAIPGIGPFSAAAILLRGLGRTDELPGLAMFEREGRAIYGAAWDEEAIARRYGDQIGYWSFYVKTGAARL
jgi:DNA-3-methyladenine glycosylase II